MDPIPSGVVITYDDNDITEHVLFGSAQFEALLNGQPGLFEFSCKDPDRVLSFTTGKIVTLTVDGLLLYAGFLLTATRKFAFPVVDTEEDVTARQWVLRGVDYNILFDKRVLRNTADYLTQIPNLVGGRQDGFAVRKLTDEYLDLPSWLDGSSRVDDVYPLSDDDEPWAWMQQGTLWRQQMENLALKSGAIWYINASGFLVWRAIEDSEAKWGFSDVPNLNTVTASPDQFQGATYGFRDIDIVEDGSNIVNDAFVWGGSEFEEEGTTIFARAQNAASIAEHDRWQMAETNFADLDFASQHSVDVRANVIVNGAPGATGDGNVNRGLRFAQWQIKATWFAHDVPTIASSPNHLRPGDLTTFILYVMGTDEHHPLIQQLPLRQIRITFPQLHTSGDSFVQFEGFWGLQISDPWTLWRYLRRNRTRITRTAALRTSSGDSTTTTPPASGSFGQFAPTPDPDGSTLLFDLPNGVGYIAGTTQVYINGILARDCVDYEESNPAAGEITFYTAPTADDKLWIVVRTIGT